jgi:hypothetical protein
MARPKARKPNARAATAATLSVNEAPHRRPGGPAEALAAGAVAPDEPQAPRRPVPARPMPADRTITIETSEPVALPGGDDLEDLFFQQGLSQDALIAQSERQRDEDLLRADDGSKRATYLAGGLVGVGLLLVGALKVMAPAKEAPQPEAPVAAAAPQPAAPQAPAAPPAPVAAAPAPEPAPTELAPAEPAPSALGAEPTAAAAETAAPAPVAEATAAIPAAAPTTTAPAPSPTQEPPAAVPAPAPAPVAAAPAPAPAAPVAAAPAAAPVAAAAPAPAPAAPAPAAPAPAPAAAAPAPAAPAPAPAAAAPTPAPAARVAVAPAAPTAQVETLRRNCEAAQTGRQWKQALQACGALFQAEPQAAVASRLAQTLLEHGRKTDALDWARRAVSTDPGYAEAYVFLGGAQQELGKRAEAKAAYQRYLQLAPKGPFADDLRAVLQSL